MKKIAMLAIAATMMGCNPPKQEAVCGGFVLRMVGGHSATMMIVSGVLLVCGATCVGLIKTSRNPSIVEEDMAE